MDEIKAKQQVVEKIKSSAKILVTVSDSPSVDALSAALALTLLLDKQEKYATSIFSGETPPAIAFLEPEKTFDDTTDSLRDFIIALNKEKADHLRYKVEGDSVKIFITPYKTTIDQSDLEFSQGDYNVELVIALGVDKQENLDKALEDHGQILHDATIITMTAGEQSSDLGGIDWHDASSSSLSEMVAGLAEALKEDKKKSLLDAPIATALLTGIVAETDRFSNEHTTSKAMTVAATLMAAGADQQLIATELQAAQQIATEPITEAPAEEEEAAETSGVEIDTTSADGSLTITKHEDSSSLSISHEGETLADLDRRVLGDEKAKEKVIEEVEAAEEAAAEEEAREEGADEPAEEPAPEPVVEVAPEAIQEEAPSVDEPVPVVDEAEPSAPANAYAPIEEPVTQSTDPILSYEPTESPTVGAAYALDDGVAEPTLGGTLNATTEQAADEARREIESDQNKTILSHAYLGDNAQAAPASGTNEGFPGASPSAPGSVGVNDFAANDAVHSAYAVEDTPTIAHGGERVIQPLTDPTATPGAAYEPTPAPVPTPAYEPTPTDLGLPLPPPIPDFSQVNGAGPALPLPTAPPPAILGDILAPEPTIPSLDTTNATPDPASAYAPESLPPISTVGVPEQPASSDPSQFQIPPQQ